MYRCIIARCRNTVTSCSNLIKLWFGFTLVGLILIFFEAEHELLTFLSKKKPLGSTNERKVEKVVHPLPIKFKTPFLSAKCHKKYLNQTYKICEELPFTEIKCGPKYSQNKPKQDQPYIVPDVIFFISIGSGRDFHFYNYLSIRSAAAIHQPERIDLYYDHLPIGKYWERTKNEIPCLNLIKIDMPTHLNGIYIPSNVQRSDVARMDLLMEQGGIYLDTDIILVKSLDPLRIHPVALGREVAQKICICMVIARKHSRFMKEYYELTKNKVREYQHQQLELFTSLLGDFVRDTKFKIHIEETSLSRPNPYISQDGMSSTTIDRTDISENYLLHIHPSCCTTRRGKVDPEWITWDEEVLRKFDGVYGEAARIALFGSPDLIYKSGEEIHEMQKKVPIFKFPPFVQKNAIFEDKDD